ncbi:hypothetical protein AMECASPLE_032893 [Ameca splendens]|uniref:Uncharacterized protein n=1 Tax=Ameca splendens TaxID=208324 RepID=A0ABV0Z4L9_9TELE
MSCAHRSYRHKISGLTPRETPGLTPGPTDASSPVIGSQTDALPSASACEGLANTSAPAPASEDQPDAVGAPASEGQPDASERIKDDKHPSPGPKIFQRLWERLILVLIPEPSDEEFEEEPSVVLVPELSN